jgi:hypothetical protein
MLQLTQQTTSDTVNLGPINQSPSPNDPKVNTSVQSGRLSHKSNLFDHLTMPFRHSQWKQRWGRITKPNDISSALTTTDPSETNWAKLGSLANLQVDS